MSRQSSGRCRVLFLVGELHTGGQERQLFYLLRALDRDRYRPAVAVWNHRETDVHVAPIRALGVPIYPMPLMRSRLGKLQAFRRLVKELEPEIVHSYAFYTNFAAHWGAFGTKAAAIGAVRNAFEWSKEDAGALVGRLSARWPRYQICNSVAAAESGRQSRSFFSAKRYDVVRNGLDLDRFRPSASTDDEPAAILGIGYLLPAKRWERVLKATQYLKGKGADFKVRVVGGGPLKSFLEQEARNLGVADRIEFAPHSDDIPGLLAVSTFLVHTADNEGCPNAVMEAMACGRAVVATDVGDVSALIEDASTGFIVPRNDAQLLAERMLTLIRDRQLCRRMGAAARAKAECDLGLDRLARETVACYRALGRDEGRLLGVGADSAGSRGGDRVPLDQDAAAVETLKE